MREDRVIAFGAIGPRTREFSYRVRATTAGRFTVPPAYAESMYDPAAQARYIFDKIETALRSLGGRLEDVVRTRVYVSDIANWEAVARVHGERFGHIRPVNTLVEARLVGPEYLVEIECEAIVEIERG